MNEHTETQLRIAVERIVRPLRAGRKRKLRMREELLGHLTAVFEEECAGEQDEAAAVARAVARLGDPAALSRELQQSLPWMDRVEMLNASESVGWNTRRMLALVIPAQLVTLLLVIGTLTLLGVGGLGGQVALARLLTPKVFGRLAIIFVLMQSLLVFWSWSYLMLAGTCTGMYRQKRSWRRAAGVWLAQVGLMALMGAIGFPYASGVAPSLSLAAWLSSTPVQVLTFCLAIPLALATALIGLATAGVEGWQYRSVRPWHELPLE